MLSLIVGKPRSLRAALARALIVPCTLCTCLAVMFGLATLLGAVASEPSTTIVTTDP